MIENPLSLLSSLFAPVVLINAGAFLVTSTSHRLSRQLDRVRRLSDLADELVGRSDAASKEKLSVIPVQVEIVVRRARLLQKALSAQYGSIGLFVSTAFALAVVALFGERAAWLPAGLALLGVAVLFASCVFLIVESRVAIDSVEWETEHALEVARRGAPKAP